ncbi:MAG: Glycosyl transferase family 39 [uncultured bacterium]|nr:MAG: Glycosyl transferase family 39 [uncultured bacterium]
MKFSFRYLPALLLILIILIAGFFRLYRIGETPKGFYVDEAALGYNAYSILQTGKDEFGKSFPAMFRSFATFQSPVYTYITVPVIAVFGLNPLSVRLPSVILGILTIPLLYFLVKKISTEKYGSILALISTFFLAVSPWHIAYSRTAYETNVALFLLILGSLMFFYALKRPWLFVASAIFYALSFSAYRAETLIVPVLVLALAIGHYKELLAGKKTFIIPVIISFILGFVLVVPMLTIMRTPGFQARTSSLNILSSRQNPWGLKEDGSTLRRIVNIPQTLSAKEFFSLYSSYLSPRYMFQLGDSGPRKPYPDMGTFFPWLLLFYLAGLYFLIKEKDRKGLKIFTFVLLLISPVPAALTRDPYSTLRALSLVIPQTILISFGLIKLWEIILPALNKYKLLVLGILILFSSTQMFISIFYLNDHFTSTYWNYGWEQIAEEIPKLDTTLPVIVDGSRGDAYILMLFFMKYDPAIYQKDNFEVPLDEYYINMERNPTKNLGRITVKNFQWGIDTDHVDQYIVAENIAIGPVQIAEHHLSIIKEVKLPNGDVAIRILRTNPQSK